MKKQNKDIKKIEKMLGLDDIAPRNREEVIKYNKKIVNKLLKGVKATKVEIAYDGGGDNGQVESVKILKGKKEISVKGVQVTLYQCQNDWTSNGFKEKVIKETQGVENALENFAYTLLEGIPYDWINNDGGYGTVTLDVKTNKVNLDHNQREYTYNDEEGHEDDEPEVEITNHCEEW